MKKLILLLSATTLLLQCLQQTKVEKTVDAFAGTQPMTHKEAADSLLADSTQPLIPVVFHTLTGDEANQVLNQYDLSSLFVKEYPDHGFYGDDRYHIEFFFTNMSKKSVDEPAVYEIKGKNRFKKVISSFAGNMTVTSVSTFTDPNLDSVNIAEMGVVKAYSLKGTFELKEDSVISTSGRFAGTFTLDFFENKDHQIELWFFSQALPSGFCGYRFDGNWGNYRRPAMTRPVIWSQDIFSFGNSILKDFSYGDRGVEINPAYRHLGWDEFWEGEEWWNNSPAEPTPPAK